ncbi:hypothetical protein OF117_18520 [Geodermatophilus sp. YIM 151500]|uniref:hypothetical protein n=1 Tax=Geodermatophilus sp. YIM 151500 TaxID=2984531 RepID=UPI0021E5156E|nr:hypothetical protein [Geodermatophilus sp. YIM 151500]MCV2491346.1 hypothetical protein [Geodermatophilus sp. YIM 151500]
MATGFGSTGPSRLQLAGEVWHALLVAARRVAAGVYFVLALLGAVVGPPSAALVWGPVVAALAAGVVALVTPGFRQSPTARRAAAAAAGLGLLAPPFSHGLGLLGPGGAVLLVALLVLGAVTVVDWMLTSPEDGPGAALCRLAQLRRVLPELPVEALEREWHDSSAALRSAAGPEAQALAVQLRAELLDELARRDPERLRRLLREQDGGPDPWGAFRGA